MKHIFSFVLLLGLAWTPSLAADSAAGFGGSIVLAENTLFVSEPSGFHEPGQVHVVRQAGIDKWVIEQSLSAGDGFVGDRFGGAIAASGDLLAVGATGANEGAGAVYLFRRGADGSYREIATLVGMDEPRFGTSVALVEGALVVGAPGDSDGHGLAQVFVPSAGDWLLLQTLRSEGGSGLGSTLAASGKWLAVGGKNSVTTFEWSGVEFKLRGSATGQGQDSDRFGASIDLDGNRLVVGAPNRGAGAVDSFTRTAQGWEFSATLLPPDLFEGRTRFGSDVQLEQNAVWASAPGAAGGGALVRVQPDGDLDVISQGGLTGRPGFGSAFAASGEFLVVGAPGDAYGEGTAIFLRRTSEGWELAGHLFNAIEARAAVAGDEVECRDGEAGGYACEGVDLLSFLPNDAMEINRGVRLNDVWGWTDPETGREYALVGHMEATAIVDVTSPTAPLYLGTLPRTEGSPGSTWRDIKVYRDHAFVVADGAGDHGMQIFDLTRLRDLAETPVLFEPDALYRGIASSHNVVINEETGFAYTVGNSSGGETCGGQLHMIDIRDPKSPKFAGCFSDGGGRGSTHDAQCIIYEGPDSEHTGREICVASNGSALTIADVTDKNETRPLSTASYPNHAYVHQGWFTEDQRYFYQNDELDEVSGAVERTRTLIWDMTDLDDPEMIGEFYGTTNATDHNLYVDGNLMYQTNNASGLRIVDISNPESPVEIGHFDTTPYGNDKAGFNGTWSSYPYFRSGTLVVTSRREGLFLVRKRTIDT